MSDDKIIPPPWVGGPLCDPMKVPTGKLKKYRRYQRIAGRIGDGPQVTYTDFELPDMTAEEMAKDVGGVHRWEMEMGMAMLQEARDMTEEEYLALYERSRSMEDPEDMTQSLEGVSGDLDQIEAIIKDYLLPAIKGTPALKVNQEMLEELEKRLGLDVLVALQACCVLVVEDLMPREEQEQLFDEAEVD